jgi:putative intracellular protease/amidase
VASPKGGVTHPDPNSIKMFAEDLKQESSIKFLAEKKSVWTNTIPIKDVLGKAAEFDAIYFAGGHGPMFDVAQNPEAQQLAREFWESHKPVSAACAGVSALSGVTLSDGSHLLRGKSITGLSKAEVDTLPGYSEAVPFVLEDKLRSVSGDYTTAPKLWGAKVVRDGNLVTGENPASAKGVAEEVLKLLKA